MLQNIRYVTLEVQKSFCLCMAIIKQFTSNFKSQKCTFLENSNIMCTSKKIT